MVRVKGVCMPEMGKDQHGHTAQPESLNSLRSDNGIPIDRHNHTDPVQAASLPIDGRCGDAETAGVRCLSEASLGTPVAQCSHVAHSHRSYWPWLALAALVLAFDQASKLWVLAAFVPGEFLPVFPSFNLVLVFNPGAAFSFLADAGGWQKWFFFCLALAVSAWVVYTIRQHPDERLQACALSLIMGGALGNAIDRVLYGAVVDFLDFYWQHWHWPAFNLADSAIFLGAVLMVWDQFHQSSVKSDAHSDTSKEI